MNEPFLEAMQRKGWVKAQDGSWSRPKRRNLAGLGQPQRERDTVQALDSGNEARKTGKASVAIRIEIISFRKRLLDSDNNQAGANKNLRDAIAKSLGFDDGDPLLQWDYQQVRTTGQPGTLVKIGMLTA